ncbi:MAG: LysR family transcriptional regulator [Oceanospirillaceae bacterium]
MRWNLDQLQAFVTTVQSGSFSAAARLLGKAQSGISTAISNLEADIGFELFNRSQRYPVLTEKGRSLYPQAYNLLQQCSNLDARINTLVSDQKFELTLAMDEVFPEQALGQALFNIERNFPDFRLTLINGSQGDIIDYVRNKQADLGLLVQNNPISEDVYAIDIGRLDYVLMCSPEHPLAKLKQVSITDLQQHRQYVYCNKRGKPYNQPLSADYWFLDSYFYIVPLVIQSGGWAIIPLNIAQLKIYNCGLTSLSVTEFKVLPASTISIIKRRNDADAQISQWLIHYLQQQFNAQLATSLV